jgi:hypothetical protein
MENVAEPTVLKTQKKFVGTAEAEGERDGDAEDVAEGEMLPEKLGRDDLVTDADAVASALGETLGEGYCAVQASSSAASRCSAAAVPTT